ncbi:MAG TPA: hypothetical protein VG518_09330 [Solirubrobacterales bacterium]|nr:hypothetical protein [Solirubrobacterales bacterium]
MKRLLLLACASLSLVALAPVLFSGAAVASGTFNVLLAGGDQSNMISIQLSADGRTYTIDSIVPLEVGGSICTNPPETSTELVCQAASVGGFEVNAGIGDDSVTVGKTVPVPVTLRGGPGNDRLTGGAANDKLVGGPGNDRLIGRGGADYLAGGEGEDTLVGGSGDDILRGGPGFDVLYGGSGSNDIRQ